MKKIGKLVASALLSTLAFSAFAETVDGYTIRNCTVDPSNSGSYNFCKPSLIKKYAKAATAQNINFANKYVLVSIKSKIPNTDEYYTYYAAVNPATKTVYPFPFTVYDDKFSSNVESVISKKSDLLCLDSRYHADGGNPMISAYGGGTTKGLMCFKFDPNFDYNFYTEPSYKPFKTKAGK